MTEGKSNWPRVAVVGAGYWGKNIVRNLNALGVLSMICDWDKNNIDELAQQYPSVTATPTFEDALTSDAVDAVAIATNAETHYDLVYKCLLAGKHVYVEKPLCLNVEDGGTLVSLARRKGLTLMVGHLLHYHPAVIKLKDMAESGEFGRIQYIYSNRLNLGKIRTEENILWSFAPHDISVILAIAGQLPDTVSSFGSHFLHKHIADVTVSNMTFPSGISAHIFVSWLHPFKEQRLVIVGDRKMIVFNDVEPDDKLVVYPHLVNWKHGIPFSSKKDGEVVPVEKKEPLREEMIHFLDSVATGATPYSDGAEGLRVLKVLDACQRSMESGGKVIEFTGKERETSTAHSWFAHETSVIDDGCDIGERTKIWHFSHILRGSRIGAGCNIGQNVVVGPNVTIGDGCKIQNNVSVYEGVTLEDDVFCGPSMVFTNVINPRSHIRRMSELKPTIVRRGATIGANATIVCGITLGRYCFIGAGAVVTKDVPDYALMVGNPARRTGWMCECGVRLSFDNDSATCDSCGAKYVLADGKVTPELT